MLGLSRITALSLALVAGLAQAATVITYPGWRGNNLITNGTIPQNDPSILGIETNKHGQHTFPYGMQYMYPCGGMPQSTNRTKWPYLGGSISFQPGWGPDNQKDFYYVNMGIQEKGQSAPSNYSLNLVPAFELTAPNATTYTGQFCLTQVPMPVNATLGIGDLVTIQLVQTTAWGAAMYNCVDIELVDPKDAIEVTAQNCYNSSYLNFQTVFTTVSLSAAHPNALAPSMMIAFGVSFIVSAIAALS